MNFFRKWFQRKPNPTSPPPSLKATSPATPPAPAEPEKPIRVFDSYGRELFISREQWRTQVLPHNLRHSWNNPDSLYSFIVTAVGDGFFPEVTPAARHLYDLGKSPRTVSLLSHLLLKQNAFDEAQSLCETFLKTSGTDGYVLTGLAQVYAARHNENAAAATLWRGLEADPNQPIAVLWYRGIHAEAAGPEAGIAALKRIAQLPGSWRSQIWIARAALENKYLATALTEYGNALDHAGSPPPADLLQQLTGDLGQHGHIEELLTLASPLFNAKHHGLTVGNNLIKAHLDAGHIAEASDILNQLAAIQTPDWKPTLNFWETEIAKARIESTELSPTEPMSMSMLFFQGPIWVPPQSPVLPLLPAKSDNPARISFLGSSAAPPAPRPKIIQQQLSNAWGRLSRAAPAFLAEQVHLRTNAIATTLVPWIIKPQPGFVLAGAPWSEEDAAHHARHTDPPADYVVATHINATEESATIELRLIRTIDAQCLARLNLSGPLKEPHQFIPKLATLLLALLAEHGIADECAPPALYEVPEQNQFDNYLLRIEQLVAVRSASTGPTAAEFLHGSREILEGNLHLTLQYPTNPTLRFLFAHTLRAMKRVQPEILPEFKARTDMLQKQYPLAAPFNHVAEKILEDAFAAEQP